MRVLLGFPSELKPHRAPPLPEWGCFSSTDGEIPHIGSVGRCGGLRVGIILYFHLFNYSAAASASITGIGSAAARMAS